DLELALLVIDLFDRTVKSVERPVNYLDGLAHVEWNGMAVGSNGKFIDFAQHTVNLAHTQRHRVAVFNFAQKYDYTGNGLNDMRNFSYQIGFNHHIARKVNAVFCDFFPIANLYHFFSRHKNLRDIISHTQSVDLS